MRTLPKCDVGGSCRERKGINVLPTNLHKVGVAESEATVWMVWGEVVRAVIGLLGQGHWYGPCWRSTFTPSDIQSVFPFWREG